MKTIMMNMTRIMDKDKVLVLDKKKKYGWEGLTFPGGKVEANETFVEGAVREVKEETNLDISNLEFNGIIQWINHDKNLREVGLLYTTKEFSGELIEENIEGNLFFANYEDFKTMEGHSYSMDYILDIYEGKYFEICMEFKNGELIEIKKY